MLACKKEYVYKCLTINSEQLTISNKKLTISSEQSKINN